MEYERIILELLNRISVLESRVEALEKGKEKTEDASAPEISKKYRLLSDYLYAASESSVSLSFGQIEEILKFKLPDSAYNHRAFWANTTSHSIALSWMNVGYQTVEVDLANRYVVFEKQRRYGK